AGAGGEVGRRRGRPRALAPQHRILPQGEKVAAAGALQSTTPHPPFGHLLPQGEKACSRRLPLGPIIVLAIAPPAREYRGGQGACMDRISHNWAEYVAFGALSTHFPASVAEVQEIVRRERKVREGG